MEKKNFTKKLIKRILAVVLIVALCFGGYTVYNFYTNMKNMSSAREVFANSLSFSIAPVERGDVQEIITSSGVVYLKEETSIVSESSEKIKEVLFSEGDYIKQGETVVIYDTADTVKSLERKIRDSEISLENANLSLKSLLLPISDTEAAKLKDAVTTAEKNVYDRGIALSNTQKDISLKLTEIEKAEKTVESNKVLYDIGAITKDEYDKNIQTAEDLNTALDKLYVTLATNERELKSAEESLETARYNYEHAFDVLTEESEKIKYQQQQNLVKSAENSLKQAKEDLEAVIYETISDVSGTVTLVSAAEGGSVQVGGTLFKVTDYNSLIVKSDVSEYDAPKLALEQTVNMTTDGMTDVIYTGKISKIAPSATTKSTAGGSESVVAIEITIDNPDGVLKPGYNLDIEIIAVDQKDVLSISQSALMREPQTKKSYVYTVNSENIAEKKYVETGLYGDLNVEITGGLNEGERIVTNPSDQLTEGMFVMTGRPVMPDGTNAGAPNMGGGMFNMFGGPNSGGGGNNVRIQQGNNGDRAYQGVPSGGAAPSDGAVRSFDGGR